SSIDYSASTFASGIAASRRLSFGACTAARHSSASFVAYELKARRAPGAFATAARKLLRCGAHGERNHETTATTRRRRRGLLLLPATPGDARKRLDHQRERGDGRHPRPAERGRRRASRRCGHGDFPRERPGVAGQAVRNRLGAPAAGKTQLA